MDMQRISLTEFSSYKMNLFNQFHRIRRFARKATNYQQVEPYVPAWFDLLKKIDGCTTLEQRLELINTNVADRKRIVEQAKEFRAPLTMHRLLDVFKGADTAMHRGDDGWHAGDPIGKWLSFYMCLNLPEDVGVSLMQEFFSRPVDGAEPD
jgi:hypothetical protein